MRLLHIFKKSIIAVSIFIFILLVLGDSIMGIVYMAITKASGYGDAFVTDDISQYGVVEGNFDNETPQSILDTFLPERIAPDFSNVTYHYKAIKGDAFACEVYLEFTVRDLESFQTYKSQWTSSCSQKHDTYLGKGFFEYSCAEYLDLIGENEIYSISGSKVLKMFISDEDQKFIFWALLAQDGGFATTRDLDYFFSKYSITPSELEFAEIRPSP